MADALKQQKHAYLRKAVEDLKAQGLTQRAIALRVDEDEGALSSKLSGKRSITDAYIDRFAKEFGIPFARQEAKSQVDQSMVDRLLQELPAVHEEMRALMRDYRDMVKERDELRARIAELEKLVVK